MASRSEPSRPVALVTGINGFTGRYVAHELQEKGYRVEGLTLGGAGAAPPTPVDLLDREALARAVDQIRPDAVVHLAAISFVAHGDVEAIYGVNVIGTRNLLEALAGARHLPKVVILASSANIYGNSTDDPVTEDTQPSPANDYAVSKLAMEHMARLWMDRLPIVITRPFNYTGVGQAKNFLIPKIVDHFRRRESRIELGNIEVWRDFSDVRDIARDYCLLAAAAPASSVFNLCSESAHSLGEVLELMEGIAGYRIDVRINPAFVREGEVIRLVGSRRRLDGIGGNGSPRISLEDTLRWMYSEF